MNKGEWKKIGDVCNVLNGYAFKSSNYQKNGVRVIRIANVQKGHITDDIPQFYPISNDISKYMLFEEDLLMSLTGNVGRVGLLEKKLLPAALNQRVACVRIKDNKMVNKSYLFHFFNNNYFEHQCILYSQGIAQKNMSTEWLKEYQIYLPSIEEQRHIAANLDKANELIALHKKQLEELDALAEAEFYKMFGDPVKNEKRWKKGKIVDTIQSINYGTSLPAVEGGKYVYLRMNNITYSGHLDLNDLKYINVEDNSLEKYIVRKGDLLFNRTNSKELVGKTAIFTEEREMVIAGYIIRVRCNSSFHSRYVWGYLNSKHGKAYLRNLCKNIVGMANINAKELQSIPLLLPPLTLQTRFASIIEKIEEQKAQVRKALQESEDLFQRLMQDLFKPD